MCLCINLLLPPGLKAGILDSTLNVVSCDLDDEDLFLAADESRPEISKIMMNWSSNQIVNSQLENL